MQRHIISVISITYAIKGRDILRKEGVKAYTERKTNLVNHTGCGYVITAYGNLDKIKAILEKSSVKILNINTIA